MVQNDLYCVKSVRMQENADQNNSEYSHFLCSGLEMDWKNFEKDRKSFGIVLKMWQNNTSRLAAFLETLHAAIIFRRFPCILSKMANSLRVSFADIQK